MEKGQKPDRPEGEQEPEENYSFLQEKIKEKPVSWKKVGYKALFIAGAGLIFGLCVCVGFYGLKPWAEEKFAQDTQKITIPKDEEPDTDEEEPEGGEKEEPKAAALTIDSYRELNRAVYDLAREASKSLVEVSVQAADAAWLESDSARKAAGLIVKDNGRSVLILTKGKLIQGENPVITVTFPDDNEYEATLVKRDMNLDMAVIAVEKSLLSDTTWSAAKYAQLGNSNVVGRGDAVIAVGSPFGYYGGVAYGILSSVKEQVILSDGSYRLLTCDIGGTADSTGILVNLQGEVIGLLRGTNESDHAGLLTAFAISDVKDQLQMLLNKEAVPYIGITGTDIPDAVREEKKLSGGIYVKEVTPDSPAMQAGIQSGDVIISIEGTDINMMSSFKNKLLTSRPGDHLKIKGMREGADGYVNINYEVTVGSKE